jgi:hypothetical protein
VALTQYALIAHELATQERSTHAQAAALIYHTVFGDKVAALRLANSLLATADSVEAPSQRMRRKRNCAIALHRNGMPLEAIDVLRKAYAESCDLRLSIQAFTSASLLSFGYVYEEDFPRAKEWHERAARHRQECEGLAELAEFYFAGVHIHLAFGDIVAARTLLDEFDNRFPIAQVTLNRLFRLALSCEIALRGDALLPEFILHQIDAQLPSILGWSNCNDLLDAYCRVLIHCGQSQTAEAVLRDHLNRYDDRVPPSAGLIELAAELRLRLAPAAQC